MLIIFEVDVRDGSWFTCNFPREAISSSLTTHYDRISKVYQKIMRYIFHLLLLKNDSMIQKVFFWMKMEKKTRSLILWIFIPIFIEMEGKNAL